MSTVTIHDKPQNVADEPAPRSAETRNRQLPVGESVLRGAVALLSTQPLTWAVSLFATAAIPRLLGAEALGEITIAATISTLAATALGLGISEFLVRRVAQQPRTLRHDVGVALFVQMGFAIIGALAIGVIVPLIAPSLVDPTLLWVSLIGLLSAPATTVLRSSFRGREQHGNYAWFTAGGTVVTTLVSVYVLMAGGGPVLYVLVGGVLPLITTLIAWKMAGMRPSLTLDGSLIQDSIAFTRGGLPFVAWQITLMAYGEIDRILLGALVPAAEVGWYSAAFRIIGSVIFIPTAILTPLFPALSRSLHDPVVLRRTITHTLRPLQFVMIGFAAGLIVGPRRCRAYWAGQRTSRTPLSSFKSSHCTYPLSLSIWFLVPSSWRSIERRAG